MHQEKAALRRSILVVIRSIDPPSHARKSAAIAERFLSLHLWAEARDVLGFHPMGEEVDVIPLLNMALEGGKRLWLPRIESGRLVFRSVDDLESGLERHSYGMQEPAASRPAFAPETAPGPVLVVTPGLAFDPQGHRLGRGKGYYDDFLRSARAACPSLSAVAVAFSEQLVDRVPHSSRDERVDAVTTEREVLLTQPCA